MKRTLFSTLVAAMAVNAHAQTPGQVPIFAQPGTGSCNSSSSSDCVDSVITQDSNGNIGIGTTTPAAALDVATGGLNIAGNILKSGTLFLHNFGPTNTFVGQNAGNLAVTGDSNAATGTNALSSNGSGFSNTANGAFALQRNTMGHTNTAIGRSALEFNVTGMANTATGRSALLLNNSGSNNTATGTGALQFSNGDGNTAFGFAALEANSTGTGNTALGAGADLSAGNLQNATAIGMGAVVNASNKIRFGNTAVTVIEGQVPYTFPSDRNQKENFQPVDGEVVLSKLGGLSLTSWNYIGHDPQQFRHYGPVAQEFFAAFGDDGVGTIGTPTTINTGDVEGILMIAVQTLTKRNAELRARIDALERMMKTIDSSTRLAER